MNKRAWSAALSLPVLALAIAGPFVAPAACSATTTSAVIQDITPAGACIANAILAGGASDPLQIVAQCIGVTIDDVFQVVESLIANQPDAGTVTDAGPSELAQRLAALHVRALGLKGVVLTKTDGSK